ncbi:MAG: pyridoxamine 5'-phosphate oxidase [Pseudonocardiales bacterium]|nr:MAG: pyridoxamine 5'-phosphate oxidase [Pseudonocardiales bacterium]
MLTEPSRGFFFDIFNRQLAHNLNGDPRVTILAVDSSKRLWLRSLIQGSFPRPPGLRLVGTAGPRRLATELEVQRWQRVVRPLLRTRGGRILWGHLRYVRDLTIDTTVPIHIGAMTRRHSIMSQAGTATQPT